MQIICKKVKGLTSLYVYLKSFEINVIINSKSSMEFLISLPSVPGKQGQCEGKVKCFLSDYFSLPSWMQCICRNK